MKKHTIYGLLVIAFVFISFPAINAQELPKATKYTDVTWYSVTYYKFKPGMADNALDLVYKYFVPADKATGRRVIHFDVAIGEWDHIAYFPLDEGPGDLAWEVSPSYEKLIQELVNKLGIEKYRELDLESFVAYSKSEIVMRRKIDE